MNADVFAQLVILGVLLLGLWKRDILDDLCDGNVERLEREDRAEEARWWLRMIRMNSRLAVSAASGRLSNKLKKLTRLERGIKGTTEDKKRLLFEAMEELADVVICVDLVAMHLGVSLQQAVRGKFNATSLKHSLKTRLT